jgi:hypothetical protein
MREGKATGKELPHSSVGRVAVVAVRLARAAPLSCRLPIRNAELLEMVGRVRLSVSPVQTYFTVPVGVVAEERTVRLAPVAPAGEGMVVALSHGLSSSATRISLTLRILRIRIPSSTIFRTAP